MGDLDGKVAIVTGAARGIGRAYAVGLGSQGANVVLADLDDSSDAARLVQETGAEAAVVHVDVSDSESTLEMASAVRDRFGRIDILVNNAGYFRDVIRDSFVDLSVEEWDKAFAVNVRGTWLCSRAVYPIMKEQDRGRIINISSMTVWKGKAGFLHYVASKSAIVGLTRALASELGADGIAVNTVVPEFIPHDLEYAKEMPWIDEKVVSQRVFKRTQTPEDMVGIVVFLSGPGSDFITGQSFLVNGGTHFQ